MKQFSITFLLLFVALMPVAVCAADSTDKTQPADANATVSQPENGVIKVNDTSGLSEKQVQQIAEQSDAAQTKTELQAQTEKSRSDGTRKPKASLWETLAPSPEKYDWIQLKTGEWLKGTFKAMYDDSLEFESETDAIDAITLDFKDVRQLRTHGVVSVGILSAESPPEGFLGLEQRKLEISGILRLERNRLLLIRGDGQLEFERSQIISIASGGEKERDHWSGKITLGLNISEGNTNTMNYSSTADIQRRTAKTRLEFDYLGNLSTSEGAQTANNHRLNQSFDIFASTRYYYTPLFSEFFSDTFQNIQSQITAGVGIGFTLFKTSKTEWDLSGGPAYIYTDYDTVTAGEAPISRSAALQLKTSYDTDLTSSIDFDFSYTITFTDRNTGNFKHHMVATLDNDITDWLSLDITAVWDYTDAPQPNADGSIPKKNDVQLTIGLGVNF